MSKVPKVQILLVRVPDVASEELRARLAAGPADGKTPPDGVRERRLIRLDDDPTRATGHAALDLDGVIELSSTTRDLDDLVNATPLLQGWVDDLVDTTLSGAVAGYEHVILPGEEPLELIFALRRRASLSADAFREHWSTVHAELGRQVPGSQGYRQLRADADAAARAAAAAGVGLNDFEGVAEVYVRDLESLGRIFGDPHVIEPLLEDERRFIDHSRSALGLYHAVG